MIYIQVDRKLISAPSYKELVLKLKNISFDEVLNKKDYMFNVSHRVEQLYDEYIENYNYKGFVRALSKLRIITLIKCADCDFFCMDTKKDNYYCSKGIKTDFNPNNVECPFITNKLIQKYQMI